jgi:hypothetical protein
MAEDLKYDWFRRATVMARNIRKPSVTSRFKLRIFQCGLEALHLMPANNCLNSRQIERLESVKFWNLILD